MFRIQSKIDPLDPGFLRQKEEYLNILNLYKERMASVMKGGPEQAMKRHKDRGKLLARERIDLLVDKNTPFIELSTLAAWDLYSNEFPSAGIITGIGVIHGKEVMIVANDATVKGGTYVKESIKK
ncbi:MAG: acyl-CoA carboxylase subunit beta, partial [Bacteroidales bacterium]|nr:acyl-CoA carboxylase subunit beta [Bacteroidales bacterium]